MALSITRSKHGSLTHPSLIHLFSTSSSSTTPPSDQSTPQNDTNSQFQQQQHQHQHQHQQQQFSFSFQFSDVKASLKQQRQNPEYQNQTNKPNLPPLRKPSNSATKVSSLEEIRKNLAEFRHRSTVPPQTESNTAGPPSNSSQPQQISFQELYNRSRLGKSEDGNENNESTLNSKNTPISGKFTFERIRESLKQMNPSLNRGRGRDPLSFSAFKGSLNLKPANEFEPTKSSVIGGTQGLPLPVSRKEDASVKAGMSTEFVKMYSYGELGEKLRSLRPEVKEGEKGWFSMEELNERLRKLREMEEKESESRIVGVSFRDLRESLVKLKKSDEEKAKQSSSQKLNLLGQLGAPSFMMHPPKEHLVEKYFHPDNMSSAEKLKIDLAKVREEFKMSESDCGSARVQVAQLTTKIKHLSSVLHKKDKHSRKGLQEMVQRRKKLLKYMRRTDWDSYCFVLSKLGLRDNPDFKN